MESKLEVALKDFVNGLNEEQETFDDELAKQKHPGENSYWTGYYAGLVQGMERVNDILECIGYTILFTNDGDHKLFKVVD